MELGLFEQVDDALRAMVDPVLGELRTSARRWGIKVWFDAAACPREHYEAQVVGARHVPEAEVLAIEVGFHAEHREDPENDAVLSVLRAAEPRWRAELGDDAVAGAFLGRAGWARLSETWLDPDLSEPELCFELADRLATYVEVVEAVRRA